MAKESHLLDRYTGANAESYDATRSSSSRFATETDSFAAMLESIRPDSVLDCPFGTGRWLASYLSMSGTIIGIDRSADMLSLAAAKVPASERGRFSIVCADLFAHDFSVYRDRGIDLVVCTRFLNWFPLDLAKEAVTRLARVGSPHMIVGASVTRPGLSFLAPLRRGLSHRENEARSYVHPERDLLGWVTGLGWRVQKRTPIFSRWDRKNYFYLLSRQSP